MAAFPPTHTFKHPDNRHLLYCVYMQRQWGEKLYSLQGACTSHGIWFISNQPFLLRDRVSFYCSLLLCCQQVWCVMCFLLCPFHSLSFSLSFSCSFHLSHPVALSHRIKFTSSKHLNTIVSPDCLDESSACFTWRFSKFSWKDWLDELIFWKLIMQMVPKCIPACWGMFQFSIRVFIKFI